MNGFAAIIALKNATQAARKATGRNGIGTRVEKRGVQVVEVSFKNDGTSDEIELSGVLTVDQAIKFLGEIQ